MSLDKLGLVSDMFLFFSLSLIEGKIFYSPKEIINYFRLINFSKEENKSIEKTITEIINLSATWIFKTMGINYFQRFKDPLTLVKSNKYSQ